MANDNTSAVGRAARAFANTINAGVNAATGGMFNRSIGALMGLTPEQVQAGTADMRASVGTAGDIATGLGSVYGAGKALAGAGMIARGAKAAVGTVPTAVSLIPTAGLGTAARYIAGRAGPGIVPVAEALPSLTKGQIAKAAGAAALFGAPIIAGMDNSVSKPAASTTPTPEITAMVKQFTDPVTAALAQGKAAPAAVSPYDQQLAALNTILHSPNMTLGDLKAVTTMLPKQNKPWSPKDVITATTNDQSTAMLNQALQEAAAKADPAEAAAARDKAYQEDFLRKVALLGSNPVNTAQAPMLIPEEAQ